jgi:hypothetical protein
VLDEALAAAPKLTTQETGLLSLSFLLAKVSSLCASRGALQTYIRDALVPFFEDLPDNSSSFHHLLYTGCASLTDERLVSIGGALHGENRHLFCEGITAEEVRSISPDAIGTPLVIPCLHDPTLYQLSSVPITIDEIATLARECDLPVAEVEALVSYQYERMHRSDEGVDADLAKAFPEPTGWHEKPSECLTKPTAPSCSQRRCGIRSDKSS